MSRRRSQAGRPATRTSAWASVTTIAILATLAARPLAAQSFECATPVTGRASGASSWTAWGLDGRNTRFASAPGTLSAAEVPRLRLAWAYSLGPVTNARSQPAVVGDVIYVASESGELAALDTRSGCRHWTYKAGGPLRSGVVASIAPNGSAEVIFVGDTRGSVHAVNARTGEGVWKVRVDPHFAAVVTGAPQLYRGTLYVPVSSYESVMTLQPGYVCCTFRGSVVALEATSGSKLWQTYTIADSSRENGRTANGTARKGPSGAAVWSTPTVDSLRDRLYVGTGNNYTDPATKGSDAILALDRTTGRILWSRQFSPNDAYNSACDIPGANGCPSARGPDADFGQPPMLVELGGGRRALVAGQKSGEVHAIDPDRDGALLWTVRTDSGGKLGGPHWGSAADARTAYVAIGGEQMTGVVDTTTKEGYRIVPDALKGGGLLALDLSTGKVRWRAPAPVCGTRAPCSPAQSAAVTAIDGAVFSGALDGHVRAYDAKSGKVLWDYDTFREFAAVNGGKARGGAIDVAGAVVAGKMVFVNSGYATFGGMPGNVLLAFIVDGRE